MTAIPALFGANGAPVPMNSTAQFAQTGASLTATITNTSSGAVTNYTGTADTNTVTLSFKDCTQCEVRGGSCSNGAVRDLTPKSGTFTGTVTGSTMTGTQTTTYAVTDSSNAGAAADSLTLNTSVTATKQ